jgi:penicillin amidase
MSYTLSGNMDKELSRYKLNVTQGLPIERVNQLIPPFDLARFPTVLSWTDINPPYGPNISESVSRLDTQRTHPNYSEQWDKMARTGRAASVVPDPILEALRRAAKLEHSIFAQASSAEGSVNGNPHVAIPPSAMFSWFGGFTGAFSVKRSYSGLPLFGFRSSGKGASNNWVVGSSRTASGRPLLCNDPHLDLTAPSIWILMHLNSKASNLNPIGASFPGVPGIVVGHNDNIAWAVTNTGADVQDLYIMSGNETHYFFNGTDMAYQVDTQIIKVKGEADVVIAVRTSYYGNIVTDNGLVKDINVPMSLRWVSTDPSIPDTTLTAFLSINYATDFTQFRAALSTYIAPSQNFVFADTAGNIGYQMSGYVPTRNPGAGYTGAWPNAGEGDPTFMWGPRIPFDDMPRTFNPPEDFIASANNQVVPGNYSLFITADWDEGSDGYRAQRITRMITQQYDHTTTSMQGIQQDYFSQLSKDYIALIENATLTGLSAGGQALKNILVAWNNEMSMGLAIPSLWAQVWRRFATIGDEESGVSYWGDMVFSYNALLGNDKACSSLKGYSTCNDFIVSVLNGVASIYGISNNALAGVPLWGSGLHLAQLEHQLLTGSPLQCLANRHVFHGGDDSTVDVGHMDLSDDALPQTAGPSFRHIADMSNVQNSLFVHPMGQDGNILSWNYDSLLQDWAFGRYLPMISSYSSSSSFSIDSQELLPQ